MADEAATETETKTETKAETKPVIDSTKPLTQQVDKLVEQLPKSEEDTKTEEKVEELPEDAGADDEEKPAIEEAAEIPYEEPVELPEIARYILDNLPTIQVLGHTSNGKDRLFAVKRAEDLPDSFEFATRRDELIFNAAIASQELNARELLQKYQQQEQQNQMQDFLNQEALDIQADIQELQGEGLLPEFKYEHTDAKFNSDPAVKEANAIYDLYQKTNEAYARAGRTYRISYRDAADKYYASQSRKQAAQRQQTQTRERTEVATKVGTGQGADESKMRRTMPPGSSMRDIIKLYNQGRI